MRLLSGLVLLAFGACFCEPPTSAAAQAGGAHALDVPIENFAKVADGLYRGAQPDAHGFAALAKLGVRTVINLRARHDDASLATAAGLSVVNLPLRVILESETPGEDEVRAFFDVLNDAARGPVFVHCHLGKDRTGAMIALYRIEHDGWSAQRAVEEMRSFGYHAEAYPELERFVLGWAVRGWARARASEDAGPSAAAR